MRSLLRVFSIIVYFLPTPVLAFSLTSTIKNPLSKDGQALPTPGALYARFAVMMTTFSGVFFLLAFLYAGVMMMTSQGSEDKIEKAKSIMIWATVGIIVVISAYVITNFYLEAANSDKLIRSR